MDESLTMSSITCVHKIDEVNFEFEVIMSNDKKPGICLQREVHDRVTNYKAKKKEKCVLNKNKNRVTFFYFMLILKESHQKAFIKQFS